MRISELSSNTLDTFSSVLKSSQVSNGDLVEDKLAALNHENGGLTVIQILKTLINIACTRHLIGKRIGELCILVYATIVQVLEK